MWKDFYITDLSGNVPGQASTYDLWVNGTQVTSQNRDGGIVTGVSYSPATNTITLNNVNRTSGLMIRAGISGLLVKLVGDNSIKHSASSNSSFLRADEGVNVTIDGGGSGTLTIEHGTQGSYPMFNMYANSSVTIKDVPKINITCGHLVMSGNINNSNTARLIINNSTGKFVTTSTRFSSVLLDIAELQLINAEVVTGRAATAKPYSSGNRTFSSAPRLAMPTT